MAGENPWTPSTTKCDNTRASLRKGNDSKKTNIPPGEVPLEHRRDRERSGETTSPSTGKKKTRTKRQFNGNHSRPSVEKGYCQKNPNLRRRSQRHNDIGRKPKEKGSCARKRASLYTEGETKKGKARWKKMSTHAQKKKKVLKGQGNIETANIHEGKEALLGGRGGGGRRIRRNHQLH